MLTPQTTAPAPSPSAGPMLLQSLRDSPAKAMPSDDAGSATSDNPVFTDLNDAGLSVEGAAARAAFAASRTGSSTSGMTRDPSSAHEQQVREGMVELGVPRPLAAELAKEDERIGLRIYLLDNSGSMQAMDGNLTTVLPGGRIEQRGSTRWEEICAFAQDHAKWNFACGVPAEYVLLNSPNQCSGTAPQEGVDYIRVDGTTRTVIDDLARLLRNNIPRGSTPITMRLREIGARIRAEAANLSSKGQLVYITVATDGLPTTINGQPDSSNMVGELKRMCNTLPVQIVFRLCTDDEKVVEFYNRVDEENELPLDILDDFESEAKEIASCGNNFFVYTPILHRIREAGTLYKLLDNIDEHKFNHLELRKMVELLSPNFVASADNRLFVGQCQELVTKQNVVFDPITKTMRPYLNVPEIKRTLKVGFRASFLPYL